MADRKKPETTPSKDMANPPDAPKPAEFDANHFNSLINVIHNLGKSDLGGILAVFRQNLRRLRVKRQPGMTAGRPGKGSNQVEFGSLSIWAKKLTKRDKAAIKQLQVLEATVTSRF